MNHSIKMLVTIGFVGLVAAGCGKNSNNQNDPALGELNQALRIAAMSPMGIPHDVYDLTNFPPLKGHPCPVPPAGKKYVINLEKRQVVIADQ